MTQSLSNQPLPPRTEATVRRAGPLKLFAFAALAFLLVILLLEGLCSFIWLFIDVRKFKSDRPVVLGQTLEERHCEHDPELGWRHIPGKRIKDFYGPGASISIDPDGFRDAPALDPTAAGRFRIVCLGDSNTLGYGVDDRFAYPAQWQALNPAVRTINMGQGGYSIGQCYLWYKKCAARVDADALVFAFIVDDIRRMAGIRTENGYGKPSFALEGGRIVVGNQPVPPKIERGRPLIEAGEWTRFLVEHSALTRSVGRLAGGLRPGPEEQNPDLLALTLAMFEELSADCRSEGRVFVLVLFPMIMEAPGIAESDPDAERIYRTVSDAVRAFAGQRGIPFLDFHPLFAALPPEQVRALYLDEVFHHFSPPGNEFIARHLDAWLAEQAADYPRRP